MTTFVRGLDLATGFHADAIRPLLDRPHTACLIGEGSEVLGYDTERSTDHEWGPRLQIFVAAEDVEPTREQIRKGLPDTYRGHPTVWYSLTAGREANHVEVATLEDWLTQRLRTISVDEPDTAAWLGIPQQHLLQLTAGAVFHDDLGQLTRLRTIYRWYPADIWRWIIAAQWHLIGNATPLLGRAVELGDVRGARLIVAKLCRLIMEMAFLQERRYWPYEKWFGRAFSDLDAAGSLGPLIDSALSDPPTGQAADPIYQALVLLARRHNALALSEPVTPTIDRFAVGVNDAIRPYLVLNTAEFIDATVDSITDHALRNLPRVGSIDQLTHTDDLLINFTGWPAALTASYRLGCRETS